MSVSRRALATLCTAALLLAMPVVPASAAAIGSSSIDGADVLSGQLANMTLRVTNGASTGGGLIPVGNEAGASIDAIQIELPPSTFGVTTVQTPAGWDGGYDDEIGFIFLTAREGKALVPGATLKIPVSGRARTVADDAVRSVPVFVSDDGGVTLTAAGAPALSTRILALSAVSLAKPEGAANGDPTRVTTAQDNATVAVTVRNHGSAARTVSPGIEQTGGGSSVTSGSVAARSVAAGGSAQFTFPTTFGAPGAVDLQASASSPSSAALPVPLERITVEPAVDLAYVADSLDPQAVQPSAVVPVAMGIRSPATQAATLTSTFSLPEVGFSTSASKTYASGNALTTVVFAGTTIPDVPTGSYDARLRAVGSDANGAEVDVSATLDELVIDGAFPVVTAVLTPTASNVSGATPAIGAGRSVTLSGTVELSDGVPCHDCRIVSAVLQTDAGEDVPIAASSSGGTFSRTFSVASFATGTTSAVARVVVAKATGLEASVTSPSVPVDIVAPAIASATTVRGVQGDAVLVDLAEAVNASGRSLVLDWSVQGNTVTEVTTVPQPDGATQYVLALSDRFADPNATPAVFFAPANGLSTRPTDRVSLALADQDVTAIDGIVPATPLIEEVAGLGLQDDAFWTNETQPTVRLSGLAAGDLIDLYFDADGSGTPAADELIFSGPATGGQQTVQVASPIAVAGAGQMIARSLLVTVSDGVQTSGLGSAPLTYDTVTPVIAGLAIAGQQVTVVFAEPLPTGRDAAFDWTISAVQDGVTASRTVTSVVAGNDLTRRVLQVSTASYDPARGDVLGVRFKFRGAEADRYGDRASNAASDQQAAVSG